MLPINHVLQIQSNICFLSSLTLSLTPLYIHLPSTSHSSSLSLSLSNTAHRFSLKESLTVHTHSTHTEIPKNTHSTETRTPKMFPEIWSKKKCSIDSSCKNCSDDEGLRILTKIAIVNSNVVVKPISLLKSKAPNSDDHHSHDCYLKFCHLCIKPLNLDKEIYMYRGDLGLCSLECRERQIYMDETKEMEATSQRILSTFRQSTGGGGRCETTKLLEEYRRRRHPFSHQRERVVFSYS